MPNGPGRLVGWRRTPDGARQGRSDIGGSAGSGSRRGRVRDVLLDSCAARSVPMPPRRPGRPAATRRRAGLLRRGRPVGVHRALPADRGYCCESGCRHCPYGYRHTDGDDGLTSHPAEHRLEVAPLGDVDQERVVGPRPADLEDLHRPPRLPRRPAERSPGSPPRSPARYTSRSGTPRPAPPPGAPAGSCRGTSSAPDRPPRGRGSCFAGSRTTTSNRSPFGDHVAQPREQVRLHEPHLRPGSGWRSASPARCACSSRSTPTTSAAPPSALA